MLRTGQTGRSESAAFLLLYLVAAVMNILMQMMAYLTGLPAVVYCFLLIAWGASVYLRIVHRRIRRDVIAIAGFLIGLFIVRLSRYIFFEHSLTIDRYMWYLYYIPYITMPMLTLDAASCVGKSERTKMPVIIGVLWTAAVLLMLGVLTNDLHHFLLRFGDMHDYSGTVMYNWLYVLVAVWIFSVTLGAFILLIMRCRLSQCRKYWYIPVIFASIGVALILLYYAVGGSPEIGGIKLYQIQEVYVLLFVGLWESCIRIGLIPSNSGYNTLFELSHINAALLNTDGETVYHAKGYSDTADDSDFLVRRQKIKGGWVIWNEDMSAVSRINSELAEATERIEEENDLIEEENHFTAEKVRYETQNRLYDHIAEHTHARLVEIDEALADMDDFDLRMKFCLLLGTYVKRCSNLMLIADKSPVISTDELYLSIRESFEHMRFLGIDCEIISEQSRKLPAAHFWQTVSEGTTPYSVRGGEMPVICLADGTAYSFAHREESLGGRPIHEIIAYNITEEYRLTAELRDKQKQASYINARLKALGETIQYLIMDKETLQIKMKIHDSFGQTLLMTKRYLNTPESVDKEELLTQWRMNIAMLKNEHEERWQQPYFISLHHAEGLGVKIEITGELPAREDLIPVVDSAITVHVTNVLRHAEGDTAYLSSEKTPQGYVLRFTNNGRPPEGPVRETGGLANLRRRAEDIGGSMEIESAPQFALILKLPEQIEEELTWPTEC